ncbi:MAG TPA: serine hydrolase [Anaerolineaceae bacterium]
MRTIAAGCLAAAGILALLQLPGYRRAAQVYPTGERIASVPVGGLSREQAGAALRQAYAVPVELVYQGSRIQADPASLGFQIDVEAVLGQAGGNDPQSFWDYLWNRAPAAEMLPLKSTIDETRLRAYLEQQIMPRYDIQPVPAAPIPARLDFTPGRRGTRLDEATALPLIEAALRSLTARTVELHALPVDPERPSLQNLQVLLEQILQTSGYQGLAEVSLADLKSGEHLDFAAQQGKSLPPGIAFTAASTMKIPVMISIFRRVPDPMPADVLKLVQEMIEASDNPSTDRVVQSVIDEVRGPLDVTEDMQALGLKNTFWAGYFYDGAPLLQSFQTPANRRTDLNTQPDLYNQTTPAEMSGLLEDIYRCADDQPNRLTRVFANDFSAGKCKQMIDLLRGNQLPVLIKAGVPDTILVGHKHGWTQGADGYLHTISDAALVSTPGGDYAMAVYLYQPTQLLFDPANVLVAHLSEAVFHFYNLPAPSAP